MTRQVATRDDHVALEITWDETHAILLQDGVPVGMFDSMKLAREAAARQQEEQAIKARGAVSVSKHGVTPLHWVTV